LKLNLRNKITINENAHLVYKKFEIFRILADEINFLIKTFEKDNIIDEFLLDNVCRLFIEKQNLLSKMCPDIKPSNYMFKYFPNKNEVKFLLK